MACLRDELHLPPEDRRKTPLCSAQLAPLDIGWAFRAVLVSELTRPRRRWYCLNPATGAFTIKEIYVNRSKIILNDLVRIVAVDLITTKNRDRHPLNSGPTHPFQQMAVVLPNSPTEQRQRESL